MVPGTKRALAPKQEARKYGLYADTTMGQKERCLIVLQDGRVISSKLSPTHCANNCNFLTYLDRASYATNKRLIENYRDDNEDLSVGGEGNNGSDETSTGSEERVDDDNPSDARSE